MALTIYVSITNNSRDACVYLKEENEGSKPENCLSKLRSMHTVDNNHRNTSVNSASMYTALPTSRCILFVTSCRVTQPSPSQ